MDPDRPFPASGCAVAAARYPPTAEGARLAAVLRLVAAITSALIYIVDPSDDPGRRPYAYAVLAAFSLYAAAVHEGTRRGWRRPSRAAAPWIDAGFVTLLVAVSDGTSSIFFPLYLLAVLGAAFGGGAAAALPVTGASVVAFSVVGGLTALRGPSFELDRTLIRPMYLGVLGYLIGFWGEHERRSRARLQLLREATALSNPRLGAERSLGSTLSAVRALLDVEACRLVVAGPDGEAWSRVATRAAPAASERAPLPAALAAALLPEPAGAALLLRRPRLGRGRAELEVLADPAGDWERPGASAEAERVATMLEAASFISVPFRHAPLHTGRLYVTSSRPRAFGRDDAEFLWHVEEQVAPVLENLRVLDRLASEAAREERRRVAGDLHDSLVQPYVGLRLGLAAARQALEAGRPEEARRDLDRLLELADGEIGALRAATRDLSEGARGVGGEALGPALERACGRFAEATGIRVGLRLEGPQQVPDRLAAEVVQLVAEALSNVRRHTAARSAEVRIAIDRRAVRVSVENDRPPGDGATAFSPRSLTRRASAMGGRAVVAIADGRTVVNVEIPL